MGANDLILSGQSLGTVLNTTPVFHSASDGVPVCERVCDFRACVKSSMVCSGGINSNRAAADGTHSAKTNSGVSVREREGEREGEKEGDPRACVKDNVVCSGDVVSDRAVFDDTHCAASVNNNPSRQSCTFPNMSFKILSWNVNGLGPKLKSKEFVSFVRSFDFICFTETFLESFVSDLFPDYKSFYKPALRFSKKEPKIGRCSGGVVCLFKSAFKPFISRVKMDYSNFLVFLIDKGMFGTSKDIVYVCAYVPPEGSPFYSFFDIDNGIELLEECLCDCLIRFDDVHIILSGDLNARTSNISYDITSFDSSVNTPHDSVPINVERDSQDKVLNNFGKLLLNSCNMFSLRILNGACNGDHNGCYTFISDAGSSVDDYFLLSNDLFNIFYSSIDLCIKERFDSDHMPLVFNIFKGNSNSYNNPCTQEEEQVVEKIVWNDDLLHTFADSMKTDESRRMLEYAISLIDNDINKALETFNDCIRKNAQCMQRTIRTNANQRSDNWFDRECRLARTSLRKLYRKFRRTGNKHDGSALSIARREYKRLLKRKEKDFHNALLSNLLSTVNDQKQFWANVQKVSHKKKFVGNNISLDEWFRHFKELLEKDCVVTEDDFEDDDTDRYFNRPISREEILLAFRKIKNKKAAGPDGIVGELLKNAGGDVIDFFIIFFNVLFQKGMYPESWSEGIVLPLYKKGNVNDPSNYRGITLSDVTSKLYSSIINCRLQEWDEENNITGEIQAGFKKNHSTVDHMFTLLALIQKQFCFGRKLYVAFIDFQKAFDSVNRKILWPILFKNGIKGNLYRCVKSMYNCVKVKVRSGSKLTQCINCTYGVKQGDVCSPVLFSLFINELAVEVIKNGKHGAMFTTDYFELFILLLADDVALLSETVIGLQTQLNSLHQVSHSMGLKVNLDKSNIIVFRKGGHLAAREKWFFNNSVMPVVNAYKYLGIFFSTKLSFTMACSHITSRAKISALCILRKLRALNNNNLNLLLRLFDSQIQPIAQYGSEIWGLEESASQCEKVHLLVLKKFLGLNNTTPNDLIYGDTGRYPIFINSIINCIRYWLELTRMDKSRLPRKAYEMLYDLDVRNKCNWVSKVRNKLYQLGFGFVWTNQGVVNFKQFLYILKDRLVSCRWQEWNTHIQNSERFSVYKTFCVVHDLKKYLAIDIPMHLKIVTAKFRMGISDISLHYYRYRKHEESDLICPLCNNAKEDDLHFLLCCPVLKKLRERYIPLKFQRDPCQFRLSLLLASENETIVKNMSTYLFKALRLRSKLSM